MIQSPELQSRLAQLRQKASEGTLSIEELREAMRYLREGREAVATAARAKPARTAKAKAQVNSDDLLAELEGL